MRPHRIREPDFFFHVTSRGNNRQDIFQTATDKLDYLDRLPDIFSSYKLRLLAYCLMTNHLHLMVQDVKGGGLIEGIRRLNGAYAQSWNRRHRRTGHVFGERYHPEVIENEAHLIFGSCYIHNNPRDAGMVKHTADYRWSSVRAYLGGSSDIPVSTDLILDLCGGPDRYAVLLEKSEGIGSTSGERLPGADKIRDVWAGGSASFRKHVESIVERRSCRRNRDRRPQGLVLNTLWSQVYEQTGVRQTEIRSLSRARRIAHARALLCALARREGIPAVEVAQLIQRTTSAVVHLANRFKAKQPVLV